MSIQNFTLNNQQIKVKSSRQGKIWLSILFLKLVTQPYSRRQVFSERTSHTLRGKFYSKPKHILCNDGRNQKWRHFAEKVLVASRNVAGCFLQLERYVL